MPAYIPITELETDPGAPGTSELWKKWRDNPIAIAEGAEDAPYMATAWHPYNGVTVGDGATGRLWSFAVDGGVASVETPLFAEGYEYRFRCVGLGGLLRVNLYRELSGAYSSDLNPPGGGNVIIDILNPKRTSGQHILVAYPGGTATQTISDFAVGSVVQFGSVIHSVEQKISRARIRSNIGNFTSGAVYLDKRLTYA